MGNVNLRRLSKAGTLKRIDPGRLLELLRPHEEFFKSRGAELPGLEIQTPLDYQKLVAVLMSPDDRTPETLLEALVFIDEMSTPNAMDDLLTEPSIRDHIDPASSPADVAVFAWLTDRELLERKHAEGALSTKRSFDSHLHLIGESEPATQPDTNNLSALETHLDDWFEKHLRGRGCRVFAFPKDDETWFLVRHGQPFRREGSIVDGEPESVFYRPEKFDVLVYRSAACELRVNAGTQGEKELYRAAFGLHLFGDELFFPSNQRFTLEPLRTDGKSSLVCSDVEGIDEILLKEIHLGWPGVHHEIEIRKSANLFAAFNDRGYTIPPSPRLLRASFTIRFSGLRSPRTVTIKPKNTAQFMRDNDSNVIEQWLSRRGFLRSASMGRDG